MINVMHFRYGFLSGGGPEKLISSLLERMDRKKFKPVLVLWLYKTHNLHGYIESIRGMGICVETIDRGQCNPLIVKDVMSLVRKHKIDILHSHEFITDIVAVAAGKLSGTPLVASAHGFARSSLATRLLEFVDMFILRFFDRVIAGSDAMVSFLGRLKIPGKKVVTVYNSIELDDFNTVAKSSVPRDSFNLSDGDVVISTVGRLSREKGHEFLLRAAAEVVKEFPRLKVLIAGDGGERERLEALAEELGISGCVRFTGFYKELSHVLAACDLFVLSSLLESLPLTLLEAMAAGKPVVATRVGDVPEAVVHGRTGLLVSPGNAFELSEAIKSVLGDLEKAKEMGRLGRTVVERKYSAEAMKEKLERVYTELYSEKRP